MLFTSHFDVNEIIGPGVVLYLKENNTLDPIKIFFCIKGNISVITKYYDGAYCGL